MKTDQPPAPPTGDLIGLATLLAASVLLPLFGGLALDNRLRTAPDFMLGGMGLGIAAAALVLWMRVRGQA
ncbi:MAG: AtpZ/AtpI family protein [Candidatus Dormibacteria bacterium]